MSKGWFGNRERHVLASKGIKSSYRRLTGKMLSRADTWDMRERFMREFGYYDEGEFNNWVHNTTDKTVFSSEHHRDGYLPALGINKDNIVDYIMQYEMGGFDTEQEMIEFFAYLVKTGQAWSLQGHYGRTAKAFIDSKYIDEEGNITSEKYGGKPIKKTASKDKNLQDLYDNLWDVVDYKGREFTQVFYGGSTYSTEKYPTRSREIIWEDEKGNQIYLYEDSIEYIPREMN